MLDERPEAADADRDVLAVLALAERARQLEQLERLPERDRVHALAGAQARELRLVLVVLGADLREWPVAAEAHLHRLAGFRIGAEFARAGRLGAVDALALVVDLRLERLPELLQQRNPVLLAAADRVEFVLELGGEVVVDVLREVPGQEPGDRAADVGRLEAAAVEDHVLAVEQHLDDAGVGRGAADAVFLERLDQRSFRIARRRLGEMLVGRHAEQRHRLADLHFRQLAAFVFVLGGLRITAFLVHREETRVDHRGAARAEHRIHARIEVDADGVERRVLHLARDRALPDQLVKLALLVVEIRRDVARAVQRGGRTDRLVRFLRVLGLVAVEVRRLRQRLRAEVLRDHLAHLLDRLGAQVHRVGSHVGDQADHALVAERDAFVQALRDLHRAAGGEAELARGLLLQRRGRERRRGPALALLRLDVGHHQATLRGLLERAARGFRVGFIGEVELFELLAAQAQQARAEALVRMRAVGFDGPVFARLERLDFLFALDDHAQRGRLHAAGREPALHLAPEHRRQVEADQVIERAARLLRVHEVHRQCARMRDRILDRARRDFGEHHAVQRAALEQAARAQDLGDVPGDRLAFAVKVGREVEGFGLGSGLRDRVDMLLVAFDDLVVHREAARRVDRALLRHEVAHVAVGRQHVEVLAEVLVDRLRLGRRFDDQEVLGHCCPRERHAGGNRQGGPAIYKESGRLVAVQWKHATPRTVKPRATGGSLQWPAGGRPCH